MLEQLRKLFARKRVADLSSVDPQFRRRTHTGVDWSGHAFAHFVPVGCRFERCNFSNAVFLQGCFGGGLEDSIYIDCTFDRATITAIAPGNARFVSCTFRDVEIVAFFARSVEMVDCEFSGVIRKAFFNGTVPADRASGLKRTRNAFEGNDFSKARLVDVGFRTGINLKLQKLPPGWKNEDLTLRPALPSSRRVGDLER